MHINRITTIGVLSVTLVACNYATSDPNSSECTPIPGVEDCHNETGDGGTTYETGDETGGGETTELAPGACIYNTNESLSGFRYQCAGQLHTSIEFDAPLNNNCDSILGESCSESHFFGPPEDTYESPAVMACCGEYDGQKEHYLEFCSFDLLDQVCISISERLEKAVQDGSFSIYGGEASKLQQFIAQNQPLCFQELLANDSNPAANEITSFFEIPNSSDWSSLQNAVIRIDSGTIVDNLSIPADQEDWLLCHGANDNDDEVFEGTPAPPGGTIYGTELAYVVDGTLSGPNLFGSDVYASTVFSPRCAAKGCSNAEFSVDPSNTSVLGVEEIELFSDSFSVTNDSGTLMTIESARVVLYDRAEASVVYDMSGAPTGYEIPSGGAYFLLVGTAANVYDHYLTSNSSPITITQFEGTWSLSSFDIDYVDQGAAHWVIEIGASDWVEPASPPLR